MIGDRQARRRPPPGIASPWRRFRGCETRTGRCSSSCLGPQGGMQLSVAQQIEGMGLAEVRIDAPTIFPGVVVEPGRKTADGSWAGCWVLSRTPGGDVGIEGIGIARLEEMLGHRVRVFLQWLVLFMLDLQAIGGVRGQGMFRRRFSNTGSSRCQPSMKSEVMPRSPISTDRRERIRGQAALIQEPAQLAQPGRRRPHAKSVGIEVRVLQAPMPLHRVVEELIDRVRDVPSVA